jgi:TolB-like protein
MNKSTLQTNNGIGASPTIYLLLALLAGMVATGCGKPHVYIHPSPGLDRISKIAVLPFDNLTKDDKSAEKVRNGFVIELLRTGSFSVMDTGETDRILQAAGLSYSAGRDTAISSVAALGTEGEDAASIPLSKRIGDALGVQAVVVGSVEAYSVERIGDRVSPEVGISARLIDGETGIIIWGSTHTRRGSAGVPIFGWGRITSLSMLSQEVIEDMVDSLAEYVP